MANHKKLNPNQKVVRVHNTTLERMKKIAWQKGMSVPGLIDSMLALYESVNGVMERNGADEKRAQAN